MFVSWWIIIIFIIIVIAFLGRIEKQETKIKELEVRVEELENNSDGDISI